jgi:hypothetical protein
MRLPKNEFAHPVVEVCTQHDQDHTLKRTTHHRQRKANAGPRDEGDATSLSSNGTDGMNRRGLIGVAGIGWMAALEGDAAGNPASGDTGAADPAGWSGPLLPTGAVADGASHPLSSRFSSLDAARRLYPHAGNLLDELDWCALQGAINTADARGGGAICVPNTGRPYVLNRPVTVNPNRVTLRGDGSTLDFRTLGRAESGVIFKADGALTYGHERHVFEGFELIGPGRDTRVAGVLFRTETDGLSSRAQIRDCSIRGFFAGVLFGDRAYAIGFSHVSIYDCTFCIQAPAHLWDAGETISFSQCYFFNSYCLVSNPGAFDLKFLACSLDYASRLVWNNNGCIDLIGCRLEIAPPTDPPIHSGNGGRVNMFGGFFLINGPRDAVHAQELFSLTEPTASVHLFSVAGWNWRTTSGKLTKGPGKVHWYDGAEITETPSSVGHP